MCSWGSGVRAERVTDEILNCRNMSFSCNSLKENLIKPYAVQSRERCVFCERLTERCRLCGAEWDVEGKQDSFNPDGNRSV